MPVTAVAPVPVSSIVTKAGNLLLDDSHVRWGVPELIRWINEGMGAILAVRPEAFANVDTHTLVAGTYQSLPNGSAILLDVVRNIASNDAAGRAIRRTDRHALDDADPNWHAGTPSAEVRHYTFDPRTPKVYYVYPPAVAGTRVEVAHAVLPSEVTAVTDTVPIGLEYIGPLVNYVCARCNMKDFEFANGAQAGAYMQAFQLSLGVSPGAGVAKP